MIEGAGKAIDILLVEDNPGDVRLAREALKESKVLKNPKGRVPRAVPVGECMRWRYEVVE